MIEHRSGVVTMGNGVTLRNIYLLVALIASRKEDGKLGTNSTT
jgi:hypothetical protein